MTNRRLDRTQPVVTRPNVYIASRVYPLANSSGISHSIIVYNAHLLAANCAQVSISTLPMLINTIQHLADDAHCRTLCALSFTYSTLRRPVKHLRAYNRFLPGSCRLFLLLLASCQLTFRRLADLPVEHLSASLTVGLLHRSVPLHLFFCAQAPCRPYHAHRSWRSCLHHAHLSL